MDPVASRLPSPKVEARQQPGRRPDGAPDPLAMHRFDELGLLVVSKAVAGFPAACIDALARIVADVRAGRLGRLKFLVFDFAHAGSDTAGSDGGFDALVREIAELVLHVPIVPVAWARAPMSGADLELALACSMLVAEQDTRFSFACGEAPSLLTYGLLAQKIGLVRTERLLDDGEPLDTEAMTQLMLLKEVAEPGAGLDGIEQFARRQARRHNARWAIYRAQRMASPVSRLDFARRH
jgi:enoyl-CoA hydratase/carnithine racemase